MNIFVPPLEMSPKRFAVATTVLFSALKQAYCALVVCDSELVTVLHTAPFFIFFIKMKITWKATNERIVVFLTEPSWLSKPPLPSQFVSYLQSQGC